MTATPGTIEYGTQLAADIAAAKARAGVDGKPIDLNLHSTFDDVTTAVNAANRYERWLTTAEAHLLQERINAHREAIAANQQAKVNAQEAIKVQKAACGGCFTIHAGDCW